MDLQMLEYTLVLIVVVVLAVPVGRWLAYAFSDEQHWGVERLSYRALGIDPAERMGARSSSS